VNNVQALDSKQTEAIDAIVARLRSRPGPLLEVLHEVQRAFGFIPDAAIAPVALGLNLSRAEVHGVISFYHYFRRHPLQRHVVQICRAEACQAVNAEALIEHAKARLGIDFHESDPARGVSLLPVYCLGNCAAGPSVMVDERLHGRMTDERFDRLIDELQ
jgi:formate dehydrogenase subunit gamma